jgi:hypothetical protein
MFWCSLHPPTTGSCNFALSQAPRELLPPPIDINLRLTSWGQGQRRTNVHHQTRPSRSRYRCVVQHRRNRRACARPNPEEGYAVRGEIAEFVVRQIQRSITKISILPTRLILNNNQKDADGEDITVDGTLKLCEDLQVEPEDVALLAVAYELKSPRVGEWNRKSWLEGRKRLGFAPFPLYFPLSIPR